MLVTALFIPGINVELTTEVDLFFIDVRNGLLYASYHDEITHEKNFATIYYLNKIDDIKKMLYVSNSLLRPILFENFPFVKIFLRIKKNNKLLNTFSRQKYYSECDFCLKVLKYKKEIEKINAPSNYEILIFYIPTIVSALFWFKSMGEQ